jgi:hypothetical protein
VILDSILGLSPIAALQFSKEKWSSSPCWRRQNALRSVIGFLGLLSEPNARSSTAIVSKQPNSPLVNSGASFGHRRKMQLLQTSLAEREGFEPPIRLPVCRISSAVHSTTLPPLRSQRHQWLNSYIDANVLATCPVLDPSWAHSADRAGADASRDLPLELGGEFPRTDYFRISAKRRQL